MTILQALVAFGLLQLVAVPTLTTPLPQDRDEFADQLNALEGAVNNLNTEEIQQESDLDVDLIKSLIELTNKKVETNKASSLEGVDEAVVEAIDQFKELDGEDRVDDLRNELLDEVHDDLGDELNNLSEISNVLPTVVPDDIDAFIDDLMNLADSNKTIHVNDDPTLDATDSLPVGGDRTATSIAGDELVSDLMDLEIVEEIVSEVITEFVPGTEPVTEAGGNEGTSYDSATPVAPTEIDDIDYELVTELAMVTEVVYDVLLDEVDSLSDDMELMTATDTPNEDSQPTFTNRLLKQNEAVLTEELITNQNNENQPEGTVVVTELITELETETDLVLTGFLGDMDVGDAYNGTDMVPTDFPDDEDFEMELWDLKAATDDMVDDDAPTFVFTTPYPSSLGSSEALDLGPDLEVVTVQSGLSCTDGRFACADGSQCVLQDTVCDIMFDCADGSDESPNVCQLDRECPSGFTKCSRSPQCIQNKDWCDGVYHCYNGADEKDCMSCVGPNGDVKNLFIEDFCDGVQDCDDNYDETSERCNHPCPLTSSKCADGLQCIKDHLFCNGFKNCRDGSDENRYCARTMQECERFEMFACDGICMIKSALCDGMPDCKDNVDERGCSDDIFSCPNGFIRRNGDHVCVYQSISSKNP